MMTHNKASGSEGLRKLLTDAADWVESVHDGEWPYHPFTRDELVERLRAASTPPLSEGAVVPVAWMHEFTDPHDGTRRRATWRHQPRDYDLQPGDVVFPLFASTPSGSEGAEPVAFSTAQVRAMAAECGVSGTVQALYRFAVAASSMNQNEKHGTGVDVGRGGER